MIVSPRISRQVPERMTVLDCFWGNGLSTVIVRLIRSWYWRFPPDTRFGSIILGILRRSERDPGMERANTLVVSGLINPAQPDTPAVITGPPKRARVCGHGRVLRCVCWAFASVDGFTRTPEDQLIDLIRKQISVGFPLEFERCTAVGLIGWRQQGDALRPSLPADGDRR